MSDILKKLKEIKDKKPYTYDELSARLHFPSQTIARWFREEKINKLYAEVLEKRLKDL